MDMHHECALSFSFPRFPECLAMARGKEDRFISLRLLLLLFVVS